jgi:hypothetical protein
LEIGNRLESRPATQAKQIAAARRRTHTLQVRLRFRTARERSKMKYLLMAGLGLMSFAATLTVEPQEASAAVCAAGPYRAGCAGYRGAAVVRRPVAPARACRTVWSGGVRRTVCY